ncbi:MAG TPA: hypothetical protein VGK40_11770 [Verrucomicrobiae bacterium]|jgi:hypothetical protein
MNRLVAQVGNLLYRRLAVGSASDTSSACGLPIRDTAQRGTAATKLLLVLVLVLDRFGFDYENEDDDEDEEICAVRDDSKGY